jgi:hypothetical protein
MSLYRCEFQDGGVIVSREFVGADIDAIENQAAEYAQSRGAEYLAAEYLHDVEVDA